jgi:hypothetical protein
LPDGDLFEGQPSHRIERVQADIVKRKFMLAIEQARTSVAETETDCNVIAYVENGGDRTHGELALIRATSVSGRATRA